MGSELGYNYDYWFCMHNSAATSICRDDPTIYEFDIRTKFYVKGSDGDDEKLGSERFIYKVIKTEYEHQVATFENAVSERLHDYWMSLDEIKTFAAHAIGFAGLGTVPLPRTITVELEVCTVQQAGETRSAATDRAIRPENLFPLFLGGDNRNFLRSMDVIRVEDDDMKMMMEECPICLRSATIGAQVVMLQDYCHHAFHLHCLVRWLLVKPCCPLCRHPITREERERWRRQRIRYYLKHGIWLLHRDQYLKHACSEAEDLDSNFTNAESGCA